MRHDQILANDYRHQNRMERITISETGCKSDGQYYDIIAENYCILAIGRTIGL